MRTLVTLGVLVTTVANAACGQQDDVAITSALVESGRLDEAEARARAGGDATSVMLGDILVLRGRLGAADSVYAAVVARGGADAAWARAGRAELALRRRDTATAARHANELIAAHERDGANWSARSRIAAGRAYVVVGGGDPAAIRQALAIFDAVAAANPTEIESRLRAAELLLDKYNAPDARQSLEEVLRISPRNARASAGLARALAFEGHADAIKQVRASLAANPSFVPALLQLARLHLEAESYDSAAAAARAALAVDSTLATAWGTLGAVAWLRGDTRGYEAAEAAARRHDPRPSDFHAEVAEAAARHRRYADAVTIATRGVEADPSSARAHGVLGTNALRVADMEAGRTHLERAFELDPYHIWNKNTLDLLDALRGFRVVDTGRFRFVAPPEEIELTVAYLAPLLEAAFDSLARRYDYRPPTPVRFEVYRRHADFSVRTVGLAGLGALGVSFGPVLAMDAPSARERGAFNWGSTAWHELAHTFTLGASAHRVPRWISEGLSVLEERRVRAGWGAGVTLEFIGAVRANRLLPVSRINEGLVRPSHPHEIGFSYYQASLVMEMIEAERGIGAIRSILRGYAEGRDTPAILRAALGMTPDSLDRHFDAWLRRRLGTALDAVDPWTGEGPVAGRYVASVSRGRALLASGSREDAITELERAAAMIPGYGGGDGAAWPLAQARVQRADTAGALAALGAITSTSETAVEPNALEARLRQGRGDAAGALVVLDRLAWIDPMDPDVHRRLAEVAEQRGDHRLMLRERRAVLALRPADRAEARYQLARALHVAGDRTAARRELLSLLEEAPGFERAQELLLTVTGGR